ncbi:hypothetical protein SDJN02_18785 [Cucurbita argyrosperma subsp. argyrosperma]
MAAENVRNSVKSSTVPHPSAFIEEVTDLPKENHISVRLEWGKGLLLHMGGFGYLFEKIWNTQRTESDRKNF